MALLLQEIHTLRWLPATDRRRVARDVVSMYVVKTLRTERGWIQASHRLIWFPSGHLVLTVQPSALVVVILDEAADRRFHLTGDRAHFPLDPESSR